MEQVFAQSWSKWNLDICLKLKVKLGKIWSKFGIKDGRVAENYEIVGNFNNFKAFVMFVVKTMEALLILVGKCSICLR
jgi:hypothetical protein